MAEGKRFVGRTEYLEAFDSFLAEEKEGRPQLLLVVGDEGMGKTALLEAMAKRAVEQGHHVIVGELEEDQPEFSEHIYPLIAMLKSKKGLELGEGSQWLKSGLFALSLAGGLWGTAAGLGSLLMEIRKTHQENAGSRDSLAGLLHRELAEVNDKYIGGNKRLVVILDPEKVTPDGMVSLLRKQADLGMPSRVRFVFAQRPGDKIITAHDEGRLHRLSPMCCTLEEIEDEEQPEFIKVYDEGEKLGGATSVVFLERYGGWPLLMEMALEEIQKADGPVNEEFIQGLPADIAGFWQKRCGEVQNQGSRSFLQTVCLLPHPYPRGRVAKFADLTHEELDAAWADPAVWRLLEKADHQETYTGQLWTDCPQPRHATCRDHVREELRAYDELFRERMSKILEHYREIIGDDLEGGGVDKDALVQVTRISQEVEDAEMYCREVLKLTEIKRRYGLLASVEEDILYAIEIAEVTGLMSASVFACELGKIYQIRGDLNRAERMYHESLDMNGGTGLTSDKISIYSNLGCVYRERGDLDRAEEMFKKCIDIDNTLGSKERLARHYGNLGVVYNVRGDLDKAEEMFRKSLGLNMELGRKVGMAIQYGNLGIVSNVRGDSKTAEDMFKESLGLNKSLGHKEGIADQYAHLGIVYQERGDLDKAEEMFKKSLEIEKELGLMRGMAADYCNLGNVYLIREDFKKAEDHYRNSLSLYRSIGGASDIDFVQRLLNKLVGTREPDRLISEFLGTDMEE